MPLRIFISAGEASGDLYASRLVAALRTRRPDAHFFGCAGPRMQAEGVYPVVDSRSLAVVGLVEVLAHLPRIYGELRKLRHAIDRERPAVAILTDSPDFHLRLAPHLNRRGVPVVYLIAPQVWAWRRGRVRLLRRAIHRLLCIFPFEEAFFRDHGVPVTYIGHPLAHLVKPTLSREEFFGCHGLPADKPLIALLPGSRHNEVERHLPPLLQAVSLLRASHHASFVLALPPGFGAQQLTFWERIRAASIQVIEGSTWDVLARAKLALAASGTVTVEAALLGVPMVTFYRVNAISWLLGRRLVRVPFLSMVNLVAGREIVPELIQQAMTGPRLAAEASRLLEHEAARETMRRELAQVARQLASSEDPMEAAARWIEKVLDEETVHAS